MTTAERASLEAFEGGKVNLLRSANEISKLALALFAKKAFGVSSPQDPLDWKRLSEQKSLLFAVTPARPADAGTR